MIAHPLAAAKEAGFAPVTHAFKREERELLLKMLLGFDGCNVILVQTRKGIEIWRDRKEMLHGEEGPPLSAAKIGSRTGNNRLWQ